MDNRYPLKNWQNVLQYVPVRNTFTVHCSTHAEIQTLALHPGQDEWYMNNYTNNFEITDLFHLLTVLIPAAFLRQTNPKVSYQTQFEVNFLNPVFLCVRAEHNDYSII